MAGVVQQAVLALEVSRRAFRGEVGQGVEDGLALVDLDALEDVGVAADHHVRPLVQGVMPHDALIVRQHRRGEVDAPVLGHHQDVHLGAQGADVLQHVVQIVDVGPTENAHRGARLVMLDAGRRGDAPHGVGAGAVGQRPVILGQDGAVSQKADLRAVVQGADDGLSRLVDVVARAHDVHAGLGHDAHGVIEALKAPVQHVVARVAHHVEARAL